VHPAGDGQVLTVSFTPTDVTDFNPVTASVVINVLPQSTPPPVIIVSEQPVFRRTIKKGKAVGKSILTGFTLDFNRPLSEPAASNPVNYRLELVATRKVKRMLERILEPIQNFAIRYVPASDSVTLKLSGSSLFPMEGRLTVLSGVARGSGGVLGASTVFTITPGGKQIGPP
jgi:hypothetical protein